MANYRGHLLGGFGAGLAYVGLVSVLPVQQLVESANLLHSWQVTAAVFVLAMLFGLFPDVDTNSRAQDIFFGIVFPVDILLIWNGNIHAAAYLGLVAMLPIITHHRGWTHTKWAMLLVPLPILLVPYWYSAASLPASAVYYGAAVAGYFSHLLLDGLITRYIRVKGGW